MSGSPATVTIAGLGLMGGSLARALRGLSAPPRVYGVDPGEGALAAAVAAGVIEAGYTELPHAPASELLVLAAAVGSISATLANEPAVANHAAITDVGSVKLPLLAAAGAGNVLERYAGSHPLCGDHRSGFAAARADLFRNAIVYVMSDAAATPRAAVAALWRAVGAIVVETSAAAHDELVALTSHLPQAAMTALTHALADCGVTVADLGPGGRDATRLAASDPGMWLDIFLYNRAALADPLLRLESSVRALRAAIGDGDAAAIRGILERAAAWRRT